MSESTKYTDDDLRAGAERLSNKYGNSPFLGAPAGLVLSGAGLPKMLRQLCAAGMVERTSNQKGSDWYYKILLEQEDSSPVTDLHTASLQAAPRIHPKKAPAIQGLSEFMELSREIIRLRNENDKLRAQVAEFSIGGASISGCSVGV